MIALYILLGILGLVIVLLAVCFVRAAMLKPTSAKTAEPPEPDMKRAAAYAKKLSAMVRQETVSSVNSISSVVWRPSSRPRSLRRRSMIGVDFRT